MKIAALFSGGKDSTFAIYWAIHRGWDVECLITMESKNKESYMYHTPNIKHAKAQAEAINIPILIQTTEGKKEEELEDLKKVLKQAKEKYGITGIVAGALASEYQRLRINIVCHELNLKVFSPLWHNNPHQYMERLVDSNFKAKIIAIAADGLSEKHLGQTINKELIEDLSKKQIHVSGEGGEYESFVLNGPIFKKELKILASKNKMEKEHTGVMEIEL